MKLPRLLHIAAFLLFTSTSFSQGGIIPTVGKDFWMGYMNNYGTYANTIDLQLFISGGTATTGTVDVPLQGWSQNFNVVPGTVTTVTVPTAMAHHVLNDVVEGRGVHITTADTVSVFAINFHPFTADASKVLPVRSLGTDYLISTFQGIGGGFALNSEFLIVATEDGTEIDITPSVATAGGNPAGVTYTIQLDEGETYQVLAATSSTDLSGTSVVGTAASGSCRPFAVFAGAQCTNIPTGCTACDHIYDQLLPTDAWGDEYYIVPFNGTSGYTYSVMARDNGTSVSIDGGAPTILNAGQSLFFNNTPTAVQVSANQPIAVTQFMQGVTCSITGDPAMLSLNGDDQKISDVTFSTVTSAVINQHNLSVVCETADVGTVLLDGVAIPAANFSPFPANPLNSYASIGITQGSHNLTAPNGFSGYVYGTGSAESYAYSVGSFQSEPPLIVDTAICTNDTVWLAPPTSLFNPEWTTLSDTNTVIGTNNQLILTPPIISDVYIITGNSLLSGCEDEYLFSVASPTTPVIDAVASEDTVCMFENVQMDVNITTPGSYNYQWSPSFYFDDPTQSNPVLTALVSGWYYVDISTIGSTCSSARDSVWIEVNGGSIGELDLQTTNPFMCAGDSTQHSLDVYQIVHFDDFNGGNDPNLWTNLAGFTNSNVCGSMTGDALLFDGGAPRVAETADMNTTGGGTIDFSIKIANGAAPCDDAEFGENVILQYSNNGGVNWTTFNTMFENAYPVFTVLSVPIPAAAQTAATRFRWIQPVFTGVAEDVWALDNVSFQILDNTGFTFTWTPSADLNDPNSLSPMAGPTADTWYVVDVLQGQCEYTDSVLVQVDDFVVDAGPDTTLCTTIGYQMVGSTSTTAPNPTYTWNQGPVLSATDILDPTIQSDTTLTYTLSVNNGLCSIEDSVTVTYIYGATFGSLGDTTICEGDSVTLDFTGFSNINWTPTTEITNPTSTNPILHPTSDQMYSVTYLSPLGCVLEDSIQFFVNELPDVSILNNDTTVCLGEPVTINTSINNVPNPVYNWVTGESTTSITTDSTGVFWVTATTACGTDTDAMTISNFALIPLDLGNDTTLCDGDDLLLNVTIPQNGSALWSDNSTGNSYTVSTTSQVWVELTDSNGCFVSDTINVDYHPVTVIDLGPDFDICEYETVQIDGTVPNGVSYVWSPGNETTGQIDVDAGGTYTVTVTDIYGCDSDDDIVITEILAPVPDIVGPVDYCITDTVTYSLTQGYNSYNWSTGSVAPTTELWGPNDYVAVAVTGLNGCIGYDTLDIQMYQIPTIALEPYYYLCDTALVQVTANLPNATSYTWDNGMTGPTVILGEGVYTVTGVAVCEVQASTEIVVGQVDFTLGNDRHICHDEEIFLAPQINSLDSILWWNDGSTSYMYGHDEPFSFYDTIQIVATAYGCGDVTDSVYIYVDDCNCPFFVPNTFTPNGDEYNNGLTIKHDCLFEEFEFRLFNRWGEIIFESQTADFQWDGTFNGRVIQDGTYVWQAVYKYAYDQERTEVYTRTGHINVIK
ncbi:MAG: hypothetical protein Crog4KO_16250 [Crocinitomicaceae bacterium]